MLDPFWLLLISLLLPFAETADLCDYRVFNWNFYLNHNKDLIKRGHRDPSSACHHWQTSGANEGRQAHPKFHTKQYCELYEDLRNAGLCKSNHLSKAVNHYLDNGYKEGRQGYHSAGGYGTWVVANDILTVSATAVHAGAISSILYKDKIEIVNSFDHGRQLQFAFTDSTGECNNPTEAGSGHDGIHEHTTSILEGIRVAPGSYIATTSQPAYWKGPDDPCTKGRGKLSPFHVAKQVTLNIAGNHNLIAYDISFTMAQSFDLLSFECPTLYMPSTFDRVFEIDMGKRSYHQIPLPADWKESITTKPIMYANAEGLAVGVLLKSINGPSGAFHYAYFGKMGSASPIDQTTKWSAWYHTGAPVAARTRIASRMYIAIGTPQEVVNALGTP